MLVGTPLDITSVFDNESLRSIEENTELMNTEQKYRAWLHWISNLVFNENFNEAIIPQLCFNRYSNDIL